MKAVFLDYATLGPDLNVDELCALLPRMEFFDNTADHEIASRIHGAEVVLTNKIQLTAATLEDATDLRFIGLTATGTDNVDLAAADRHEVIVCNIRAYCTRSVAEHVFGCLLNLTHSLGRYDAAVRAGDWRRGDQFCVLSYPLHELSAMTLGIVGYGELGKGVADLALAFGMTVIVSSRPGSESASSGRVTFGELLKKSDVISLHCPLTEHTRELFGATEFDKMKPNAILINTARGGLIDSAALSNALRSGNIAAAAIDVLPQEPPLDGDPLLDYEGSNLILTPHVAWATIEARQAAINELTANVGAFLDGNERNRVI